MRTFCKLYNELFEKEEYMNISIDAKVIYTFMLSRLNLSKINNWADENGDIYIIFSVSEVMNKLNCAKQKAVKVLKELEDIGFIIKKKQGGGKVNLIYVTDVFEESASKEVIEDDTCVDDSQKEIFFIDNYDFIPDNNVISEEKHNNIDLNNLKYENHTSNYYNNLIQKQEHENHTSLGMNIIPNEVRKSYPSYINNNNIYYNTIYPINQSSSIIYNNTREPEDRLMDEYAYYEKLFKKNIAYEDFMDRTDPNPLVNEILNTMLDVVTTSKKTVRVNGENKPVEIVKPIFCKIKSNHISYILESIRKTDSDIKNIKAYLITAIYNSYLTYDTYLTVKVNYDMSNLNRENNTQDYDEKRRRKLNLPEENHDYDWDEIYRRNLEKLEITLEEAEKEAEKLDKPIEKIKTEQEKWEEKHLRELEERVMNLV